MGLVIQRQSVGFTVGPGQKGLGGFVMHARHGLLTPYLSDEWFECIRHCCEEARERGMVPWAYDERDWPSGPAGGEGDIIHPPNDPVAHVCQMFSDHPGGCNVTLGDGAVRFVSEMINHDVWAALSSFDGGEAVSGDAY